MNDADARVLALEEELAACKARIYDLEAALGIRQRDDIGLYFRLTVQASKLLGLLLAVPNATPEMMQQRIGVGDTKVAISRLRSALRGHGIEIHNKRSLGYWLDAETKLRIKELVTPQVTSASAPSLVPFDTSDDTKEAA